MPNDDKMDVQMKHCAEGLQERKKLFEDHLTRCSTKWNGVRELQEQVKVHVEVDKTMQDSLNSKLDGFTKVLSSHGSKIDDLRQDKFRTHGGMWVLAVLCSTLLGLAAIVSLAVQVAKLTGGP